MEQLSPLLSVVAGGLVIAVGFLVQRRIRRRKRDALQVALASFRIIALGFSAAAVLLWFSLPSTPSLSTFGYPDTLEEISDPKRVLDLLQRYNRAIVRITEVLHWFIFLFVFWLLASTMSVVRTLTRGSVQQ